MKITPKILSIPPYLSTSWAQIQALYLKGSDLVICLLDGASIVIPGLKTQEIETIFQAHSIFTENALKPTEKPIQFLQMPNSQLTTSSLGQNTEGIAAMQLNFDNIEAFSSALQHNSEQSHMPSLPQEVLKKIAAIAKIVAPEDMENMPKPEPFCNCPHCQIARAIHGQMEEEKKETSLSTEHEEEIVSEKDLVFQQWDIQQTGNQLYSVTNRLDTQEKYNVYLGHPVGCTCGASGCEHILAVLKS